MGISVRQAVLSLCALNLILMLAACVPITSADVPSNPTAVPDAIPTATGAAATSTASQTADVRVGDGFNVVLEGNPTTGYNWYVKEIDTSIVEKVGESSFSPLLNLPGAGGTVTTRFRGVSPGHTVILMVLERSFEENSTIRTYSIDVTVK